MVAVRAKVTGNVPTYNVPISDGRGQVTKEYYDFFVSVKQSIFYQNEDTINDLVNRTYTVALSGAVTGSAQLVNDGTATISTTLASHTHSISDVTNLQTTLDGKAAASHTHSTSDITSGTFADARIAKSNITQHIDDTATTTTDIWSSDKINTEIQAVTAGVLATLPRESSTLTISSGAITLTTGKGEAVIDTEGGAASDTLDTINGGTLGQLLVVRTINDARDVTISTSGGNITGANFTLSTSKDSCLLLKITSGSWLTINFTNV